MMLKKKFQQMLAKGTSEFLGLFIKILYEQANSANVLVIKKERERKAYKRIKIM